MSAAIRGGRPRVSIVTPAYNGARFLRETLESAFRQTLPPVEVIIVDDASTDETRDIVRAIAPTAPVPVRLIERAHNSGGPATPINEGVAQATGEFILVLDQDDLLEPDTLARHTQLLTSHPELSFSFELAGVAARPGEPVLPAEGVASLLRKGTDRDGWIELSSQTLIAELLRVGNFIRGFPAFLFSRRRWIEAGGVPTTWKTVGDFAFLLRLSQLGPAAFRNVIGYQRRLHEGNLSHDWSLVIEELFQSSLEAYRRSPAGCPSTRHAAWDRVCFTANHYRHVNQARRALRCQIDAIRVLGCSASLIPTLAKTLAEIVLSL